MRKKQPVMSHDPLATLTETDAPVKTTRRRGKAAAAIVPEEQVTPESDASSTVELQLPASFTIADVAEVHSLLRDSLVAMSSLSIDAAQVETIDTAGLQLLAAAHKTAVEKGVSIELRNPSEVLRRAAGQIGLAGLFDSASKPVNG